MAKLHPIIRAAGRDGDLPKWATMTRGRRAHSERVALLLWKWGKKLELPKRERLRWRAAGRLHDALKDVSPKALRKRYGNAKDWPDPIIHGPACAERLRERGVNDEDFLLAISHHTTGHPEFDRLGQALYLADYLEPGRRRIKVRRADWRGRMPEDWDAVLLEVAASKITRLLHRQVSVPQVTFEFWTKLTS